LCLSAQKTLSDFTIRGCLMGEMQEKTDTRLLRDYAEHGDEAAFREIVMRYTDLVYSAALRQVESSDLAADIAQGVFADLARKAKSVSARFPAEASLAGWLHRATRYAALNHLRDNCRRVTNERQAMDQLLANTDPSVDWQQIRPVLDEALDSLGDDDREALLLRYFKNQDFRAVGYALGISDDTAQKRVSRAIERLREFFSKRKVTIGASGLVALISANAIQAAPAGLAATISAAALAGTAVSASTVIAVTKTIAMTTLQKTIVTATVAVLAGAGIYEARQAAQLREQNQAFRQQQAPLTEQIQQLRSRFAEATNQLADLIAENARLKSNSDGSELLRSRAEVTRLKNVQAQTESDPVEIAARKWLNKVHLLKQHLEQTPNVKIPELQFATEKDWLDAVVTGDFSGKFESNTDDEWRWDLRNLYGWLENRFGAMGSRALQKYIQAHNGQFPTDVSQLQQYFDSPVDDAILQRYEIVPASSIPQAEKLGDDWLVAQKIRTDVNEGREVFGAKSWANNEKFW
jgi:RNA polymerase sigma factor (sigma-70 family)